MADTPDILPPPDSALAETVISADPRVRLLQSARDLVAYRELFWAFVVRDIKVRYKQTALGVLWVILQPIILGGLFAVVFSALRGNSERGLADILFFMAGLVPWTAFANGLQMASMSMEANANMVTKVYFPRMVIPGAHICGSLLDFLIAFTVFVVLSAVAGRFTPWLLVAMPGLVVIQLMTAWGIGLILGALNAQYRDVKYVVPFVLQALLFLVVPLSLYSWKPYWLQEILTFNPMAAVVETYRSLIVQRPVDWLLIGKGMVMALVFLVAGMRFFTYRERRMVDIL